MAENSEIHDDLCSMLTTLPVLYSNEWWQHHYPRSDGKWASLIFGG